MLLPDLLASLLLGAAGSSHCVFMCGGIQGALITSHEKGVRLMPYFNMGRILSYTFIGLLFGSLGFALQGSHPDLVPVARFISGLLLLAMAAYVGRWWKGLAVLEQLAVPVWNVVQPFARQLMPAQSVGGAMAAGALWGWLPCGLVYSALAWAMLAGTPVDAALRMFFFGIGTLPALLGSGFLAGRLAIYLRSQIASNINALLLVLFAVWTIFPVWQHFFTPAGAGHSHHGPAQTHNFPADHRH